MRLAEAPENASQLREGAFDPGTLTISACPAKSLTDGAAFAFRRHQELRSFDRLASLLQARQFQQLPS